MTTLSGQAPSSCLPDFIAFFTLVVITILATMIQFIYMTKLHYLEV